jgi:hypothetical protein
MLIAPLQPKAARVIRNLSWEQLEELDRSLLLTDFPIALFCRAITYHDQYDAVRDFR